MKLSINVVSDLTFRVEYFENSEGGMDSDTYGNEVYTIEEAVHLLSLANVAQPNYDWTITVYVDTKIEKGK